jgi:CheY-like chemotaxis protein
MDIRLGGEMDGIETALALRERGIGSLFASANSDPGTIARGEAAEPLGWLRKPFSDHALTGAVEQALAGLLGE